MWEEAGVCMPMVCWRQATAATEGLSGRARNVQDFTVRVMHVLWRGHRFGH